MIVRSIFSKFVCKNDFENDFEIMFKKNDFEIVIFEIDFEIVLFEERFRNRSFGNPAQSESDFEILKMNDFEILDFPIPLKLFCSSV